MHENSLKKFKFSLHLNYIRKRGFCQIMSDFFVCIKTPKNYKIPVIKFMPFTDL